MKKEKFFPRLYLCPVLCALCYSAGADGRFDYKFSGYGLGGVFEDNFFGDFMVRARGNYAIAAGKTIGAAYAIDQLALQRGQAAKDAFLFVQDSELGRIEIGITNSIASKLGVGLPDAGGLRINDEPLFYKWSAKGPAIGNTATNSGPYDLRANYASIPTAPLQWGFSVAPWSPHFDHALDAGVKYRNSAGKIKTAVSFGVSFLDHPDGFAGEIYAPRVYANSRTQASAGLNLQYNSLIWGTSARYIYDSNPIGVRSDGLSAGTGISYDFLSWTGSLSYLLSDTHDYFIQTGIASAKYKYSKHWSIWVSIGTTPFVSAGIGAKF